MMGNDQYDGSHRGYGPGYGMMGPGYMTGGSGYGPDMMGYGAADDSNQRGAGYRGKRLC